jgi:hypothetical protein
MHSVLTNPDAQRKMVASALEYVKRNSWDTRKADYLELVDSLCAKP